MSVLYGASGFVVASDGLSVGSDFFGPLCERNKIVSSSSRKLRSKLDGGGGSGGNRGGAGQEGGSGGVGGLCAQPTTKVISKSSGSSDLRMVFLSDRDGGLDQVLLDNPGPRVRGGQHGGLVGPLLLVDDLGFLKLQLHRA